MGLCRIDWNVHVRFFFFFKQKTAYEMRISDWSSDVCSSDLPQVDRIAGLRPALAADAQIQRRADAGAPAQMHRAEIPEKSERGIADVLVDQCAQHECGIAHRAAAGIVAGVGQHYRSEEHTSELQSLMRISYAVFRLKQKKKN